MIDFILTIIAIINISTILEMDKIAKPLREFFGIEHVNDIPSKPPKFEGIFGYIGNLLYCFKCISVWVGFFLMLILHINKKLYKFIILTFSFSWIAFFFKFEFSEFLQNLSIRLLNKLT